MIEVSIAWDRLEQHSESREISFESFNFQIAYLLYSSFGDFDYDYNAPGSEFYLHLTQDCPELKATAGQTVGWQAKFWLNRSAPDNTSFAQGRRKILVEGLTTSKKYEPNLKTWIICTPGQPLNTEPHRPKDALLAELAEVDPAISILFWNKPVYEAFLHRHYELFSPLFWHYFGEHFLGQEVCRKRTKTTLLSLQERFDVELYVRGSGDDEIWKLIHLDRSLGSLTSRITELRRHLTILGDQLDFPFHRERFTEQQVDALEKLRAVGTGLAREVVSYDDRLHTIRQADSLAELFDERRAGVVDAYRSVRESLQEEKSLWVLDWRLEQLLEGLSAVASELRSILQNEIHVLATAGYGKTCLACHIAAKCLEDEIPAVLFTGRLLSDTAPIASQIVARLGLPNGWTLRNVFACLNNLGFLRRKKVPIIIDGLNETAPNSSRWHQELTELSALAIEFPHVLLMTTTRTAYCERIFGAERPEEVPNAIELTGFVGYKVDYAVRKYFDKYEILATNWSISHKIFAHPLLLKMFCVVNKGSSVEVSYASVFAAIEEYVEHAARAAVSVAGDVNRFMLPILIRRIHQLGQYLWDSNSRSVPYPEALPQILDPDWNGKDDWRETFSGRLLDEGLLLGREVRQGEEVVEFAYDLVAGIVIAKAVFFSGPHPPIDTLCTEQARQGLGSGSEAPTHPLAEDILRALIYLWPNYSGGTQLIEVFEHPDCLRFSFEMLDAVCRTDTGMAAMRETVLQRPRLCDELRLFAVGVIDAVLERGFFAAIPILSDLVLELSVSEVNLIWSEAIRARRAAIAMWLERFKPDLIPPAWRAPVLEFLAMLGSSPLHVVRDRALLALVQLSETEPDALRSTTAKFVPVSDLYILEHLIAALCGITLRSRLPEASLDISAFLVDQVVRKLISSHVCILDYLDAVFAYTAYLAESNYQGTWLAELPELAWQMEEVPSSELAEDLASLGYTVIDYDFARTHLRYLTHSSDYTRISSEKEITRKLTLRMKERGYDLELLAGLDKRIADESERRQHYFERVSESYCRKMCWITFHELCGQMLLGDTLRPALGRFRLLYGRIDPTFPGRPSKRQIFTRCCVAHQNQPIEEWVSESEPMPYFEDLKILENDAKGNSSTWVLVYGELGQSGRAHSKLNVYWHAMLCPLHRMDFLLDRLRARVEYHAVTDWDKLLAGEIPWRLNSQDKDEPYEDDLADTLYAVERYTWESKNHVMANPAPIPFLHHRIALASGLRFEPDGMMYLDHHGFPATRLLWDSTSTFLYARKDILQAYCDVTDNALIWQEHSFKFGFLDGKDEFSDGFRGDAYFAGSFSL